MRMRYWLTYDLGLRGEYQELYGWLDDNDAKECGDGVATLVSSKSWKTIQTELKKILDDKARVYLVYKKKDGSFTGTFILGKRKRAPWSGYGAKAVGVDSEDEG